MRLASLARIWRAPRNGNLSQIERLNLVTPALAQGGDPSAPKPVVLTDEQQKYPPGLYLDLLEDPSGKLTIGQVSSAAFDSKFLPSQSEVPNKGYTRSAYWVRLKLDNESRQTDEWLLETDFANTQYVDLYTPLPDGNGFQVRQTGSFMKMH